MESENNNPSEKIFGGGGGNPGKSVNGCDREFANLIHTLNTNSWEHLVANLAIFAAALAKENPGSYEDLKKWYGSWYRVGAFSIEDQGFLNYFGGLLRYLKARAAELAALYDELADYRSKATLKLILGHWMTMRPDMRYYGREWVYKHYFDLDLIPSGDNEVFVDCGAFIGDTLEEFISEYGTGYKSIYSFELSPSTFEIMKKTAEKYPRVYPINAGVSNENKEILFRDLSGQGAASGSRLAGGQGNAKSRVVRIDDEIKEDVTFIKMDVEGAEIDALLGAKEQILRNRPKLAISLYHNISDLIEIPRLIRSFDKSYVFYMRQNPANVGFPSEYVLFAL
ncbi:MAG: FkbM family methyltransferase [Clostridiales bacterium]|jgi:FkbM family methyltransferase|nr:FkbM family methyltransferase [Clostridiales bacterium]